MIRPLLIATALLPISACGSPAEDGVGGVSASEASALNNAAAMLDARTGSAKPDATGINPAASAASRANRDRTAPNAASPQ